MSPADITVRRAQPDHAPEVVHLLVASDSTLFSFCGGGSLEPWRTLAEAEFRAATGIYSYRFSHVIESGGRIFGLMIGFPAKIGLSLDWSFSNSKPTMNPIAWEHTVKRYLSIEPRLFPPIPPDSFYIQNISVAAECRNKGLGRVLLEVARQEAAASGLSRITLDVSANNSAVHFYERCGFTTIQLSPSPGPELEPHLRMELRLC